MEAVEQSRIRLLRKPYRQAELAAAIEEVFVASSLSGVKLETLARRVVPFLAVLIAALIAILLVPWFSLALVG